MTTIFDLPFLWLAAGLGSAEHMQTHCDQCLLKTSVSLADLPWLLLLRALWTFLESSMRYRVTHCPGGSRHQWSGRFAPGRGRVDVQLGSEAVKRWHQAGRQQGTGCLPLSEASP